MLHVNITDIHLTLYSARIGKAEDEEDMKRELEEMRRKKRKK